MVGSKNDRELGHAEGFLKRNVELAFNEFRQRRSTVCHQTMTLEMDVKNAPKKKSIVILSKDSV
jgi:hypothetical protein